MSGVQTFLAQHNFNVEPVFDGKIHRFARNSDPDDNNAWMIGHEFVSSTGKKVVTIKCGDWKTSESYEFTDEESQALDPTEYAELVFAKREQEKKLKEEAKKARLLTAEIAEKIWEVAHGPNGHTSEYLERKKIPSFFGAKTILTEELSATLVAAGREKEGKRIPHGYLNLLIPTRDAEGKLWGLVIVQPSGEKRWMTGQLCDGVFHLLGEWPAREEGEIFVAEGFATAASIHMALKAPVICAFNAGNLPKVARSVKKKYPNLKLVICGDDDAHTEQNAGRRYAEQAAHESAGTARFPVFKNPNGRSTTDWNDLHCLEGIEEVGRQLRAPLPVVDTSVIAPLPGKMSPSKHQQAASRLVNFYGDKIKKQDRDLFIYTGTHWKLLDIASTDLIKQQLQTLFGNQATSGQVDSAFTLFKMHVSPVPEGVNLFTPPQWAANFRNGTLHVVKEGRKYLTEFRPHAMGDWVINVLPYDYDSERRAKNPEFTAMLSRLFQGDTDAHQKYLAIREMFGATLIPAFPHLFMLHGAPGTGKSSVIILASRLAHADNTCSVDPTEFNEFNMETMAGKLVNFDTDIEMHRAISEKQIKKIIDRQPFRIKRKGIRDLYAPIPSVHIFGGNDIPKTLDGASRAQDRRWTFIGFDRVMAKGDYDLDYVSFCFNQSPEGILNFALEGLDDLLARGGHFSVPDSGREKMEDWQLQTDALGQFLRDISRGQVLDNNSQVRLGETWRIKQSQLWTVFKVWHLDVHSAEPKMTRFKFYASCRARGFETHPVKGVDHFRGIGIFEVESSVY